MRRPFLLSGMRPVVLAIAVLSIVQPHLTSGQTESPPLRVGISPFPPFAILGNPGTEPKGFSVDLWKAVASRMGRKYEFVRSPGIADKLKKLESGQTDVAIGGISATEKREVVLDFTYPTFRTGLDILTRREHGIPIFAVLKSMITGTKVGVAAGFLLMILIAGHLIWLAERGKPSFSDKYIPGILEGVYWAVVTASTVGYGDKTPVKWAGRFLAMIVIVVSLPMFALFTADLASNLTLHQLRSNLQGPAELRDLSVGVVAGSTGQTAAHEYGARLVPFDTLDDAIGALRDGRVEAVVHDAPALRYYVNQKDGSWAAVVGKTFKPQLYAFAVSEGSALREPLNRAILAVQEDGTLDNLTRKWFGTDRE